MINQIFISIYLGNNINIFFVFDNINNNTNVPRSCFQIEIDIDYWTDSFDLFHFGINLSNAYKLPIYSTNEKK